MKIAFSQKQKRYLKLHFDKKYNPSDVDLEYMFQKLKRKGRIPEKFYRM